MAIENIIARGIGFNPGNIKFIVTHGLSVGAAIITDEIIPFTLYVKRTLVKDIHVLQTYSMDGYIQRTLDSDVEF